MQTSPRHSLRAGACAAALVLLAMLTGCGGGGGDAAAAPGNTAGALATALPEASAQCTAGAMRIRIGLDANGNGVLESGEVSYTELVCTPAAGGTSPMLVSVLPEPAGSQCPTGGQRVLVGPDMDTGWGFTSDFTMDASLRVDYMNIGADAHGSAIVVWQEVDRAGSTGASRLYARRYQAGTGWEATQVLDAAAAPNIAAVPRNFAMNEAGEAVIFTPSHDPSAPSAPQDAVVRRFHPASGWSAPVAVAAPCWRSSICLDGSGTALLVWLVEDGSGGVQVTSTHLYRDGSASAPVAAESLAYADEFNARLACNASGSAIFTTQSQLQIPRAMRYLPGIGWEPSVELDTAISRGMYHDPAVAIDPAGNAMVVWTRSQTLGSPILSRRVTAAGAWEPAAPVTGSLPSTRGGRVHPKLALDALGRGVLVWRESGLLANRYVPGRGWLEPGILDDGAGAAIGAGAALALAPDGTGMAIWFREYAGAGDRQLMFSRYR